MTSRSTAASGRALVTAGVFLAAVAGFALLASRGAASSEEREPGQDSPREAMEWILMGQRDEFGNIPRDGLMRAKAHADRMRERTSRSASARSGGAGTMAAGIANSLWSWIGPNNIGGRVRALAVHPALPSTLFTGGVAGGIWKSTDGGANWRLIDDFMGNLAVSTIVIHPVDPNRLFAGTGEGFFNADSIRGAGVFTSTDQGETWSRLPSTANTDFDFVNRLALSADGSILIAATRTGLFRSTDLGASWASVHVQPDMFDVKFIPGSNSQVVASGRFRNAFRSGNGGQSWTLSAGLVTVATANRVELAVSKSAPNVVYASVDQSSGQIWKSIDSGASYAQVSTPAHLSSQGWYDNAIWVDPTNPDHVIAGGVFLFRSQNGGLNFGGINSCHVDQHAIVEDPNYNGTSNRRVYFGSDGGVCKMEDVFTNVVTSLRAGLGITQFYGAGGHAGAGRIIGGTQDNGTLRYDVGAGTNVWAIQHGSDGGFSAADPTDPDILYGEIQNFRIFRTLTGNSPSQYIYGGTGNQSCTKPVPYQITDACNGTANFIAPFMLDPNEPNRLLAGGRSLWRTNDARTPNTTGTGPSWAQIKLPTTNNSNISAIGVAPGNSDIVWVGHNNGDVYVSTNGTAVTPSWTRVDGTGNLPNRVVHSIAIDPADSQSVFVSFAGYSPESLWRSTNGGATWADSTGTGLSGLPEAPIRWVTFHPFIAGWVYAASDVGVFASEDSGASWTSPHDGPSNVAVFQLFWMDSTLVAVTHGRGMYTLTTVTTAPAFSKRPLSQGVLPGQTVVFNIAVIGVPPFTFQWYRGHSGDTSNPIGGATGTSFSTGPLNTTTSFWVRVTNPVGSADSPTATLTLLPWSTLIPGTRVQNPSASLITSQPTSQHVAPGGTATFIVRAGEGATYQWQTSIDGRRWTPLLDARPMRGASTQALRISPVARHLDGARYRCIVTLGGVTQVSDGVTLTVR